MVETALFSIFHREPPQHPVEAAEPERPAIQGIGSAVAYETPPPSSAAPVLEHDESEPPLDPVEALAEEPFFSRIDDGLAFEGEIYMSGIQADHELLGLASPDVFTVNASFGGEGSIDLNADRSGIYRPRGFRAAPWSGFAYDQAPDGLTGLAVGTRLLTARGEVPVEGLLPGDAVLALRGPALLPITWVGRSSASEPPILIEQGALGPNRPRRPLYLAPDHPVFIDPIPIPARQLINGTTIRATSAGLAEVFHVDVGASEVLFAEGVPLSSGSRAGTAART